MPSIAAYETKMRDQGYAAVRESAQNAQRAITSNPVARRVGRTYFRTRACCATAAAGPDPSRAVASAPRSSPGAGRLGRAERRTTQAGHGLLEPSGNTVERLTLLKGPAGRC